MNAGPALLIDVTVNEIASSKSFIWKVIKNKIITSNDYNLVKRNRLNNSKYAVCIVLIEKEIIDMKFKKGLYITRQRIMEKIKDKCEIRELENFSKEDEERCLDA